MVYNLRAWLKAQFATMPLYTNGFTAKSPDDAVSLNEGAGDDRLYFTRQDEIIQFMSRATTKPLARKNALSLYNYMSKRYGGCEFPAATVDGEVFPIMTAWAIKPVNMPQYVGDDENGRHFFSFSVDITSSLKTLQ